MKYLKVIYFSLLFLFIQTHIEAQQTVYPESIQEKIDLAKQLFVNERYISSFKEFEKIEKVVDSKSEIYSEAEYYRAVCALNAGYSSGSKLIKKFITENAESPYINEARLNYGNYQFEKKQFIPALRTFSEIRKNELSEKERIKLEYQTGYCYLMTDNPGKALGYFSEIKDANNLYSKPATYYWAHIMYLQGDYSAALEGFTKLNDDPAFSRVIPLYVSHIYYKQEEYKKVVDYTTPIIDDVEKEHQNELSKIVGDSWFHLGNYKKAIPFLERFFNSKGPKTREENYILGYCYYNTGNYEKATPLLKHATKGKDKMAQNAYYHLADCYIKADEKEKAKMAYGAASEFDFDEKIKEDALFNYAKLTYELSYSPFNETIKAFDNYIALYPNSERNSEAYKILTEVYMVTKNYSDAIKSIEKIKVKTPAILSAYQRVTFYRGLELFNNLAYNSAIKLFDVSLENGSYSKELKARALFWKAEALYRVGDFSDAIVNYTQFINTPRSNLLNEYKNAEYNLAYSYFKVDDFDSSLNHFKKFIAGTKNRRTEKVADAYNRIGDYYFYKTDYATAKENYRQAYAMKIYEADYSLFQIAFCEGLLRNQQKKIANLEKLLAEFPNSDFQDNALYELGRAYERTGKSAEATVQYKKIIQHFPQSNYFRKALLQLGLINYNNGNYSAALKNYKQVAEKYAGTPEARAALSGIKNCYIETNNIDAYFAYTRQLGSGANVTVSEQDSLTYMAAERIYMAGGANAKAQLERYLQRYPNGSFALNANFYLGELYYKEGDYSNANKHYTFVTQQPDNIFTEPALAKASELTFSAENYAAALKLFDRLEKISNSKWNTLRANTGQMRCNLLFEKYSSAIAAAQKVKHSGIAGEELIREANYIEGRSYYQLNQPDKALAGLTAVAVDTKYEQGAEAKYLISEIYYQKKKKEAAEKEIMDFISENTPYPFWLGKSFLLLTKIYLDRDDTFTAKHTLKSLIDNYGNETDGIKDEAKKMLSEIETKEAEEEKNAIDSSFQIEIKQ